MELHQLVQVADGLLTIQFDGEPPVDIVRPVIARYDRLRHEGKL